MYISRVVVRNFRNLQHLDVSLNPGVTCVVGENNTGKTNLLMAMRLAIDSTFSSQYRVLLPSDFSSGLDYSTPQHILISLEFRDFAGKINEEAMASMWAIEDDVARVSYRFRPRPSIIEAIESGEKADNDLTIDDYRWEIVGAGGEINPATVEWNKSFGRSIRFEELQQFLVVILPPLRDVEQSLRQSRFSPLNKILIGSEIPKEEQESLVNILSDANDSIANSATISIIGEKINDSFAESAGEAFRMDVELGMASPSFNDISRSLTVLLTNKAMTRFDPSLNGLGLNNILYVSMLLRFFEERMRAGKTPGQLLLFEEPEAHLHPQLQRVLFNTLMNKPFQTIASTHSTHVTSHVPLGSIIVLTDDGSPATASCVPTTQAQLSERQVADLERYLDATRGSLLYARKVMLVEGPAELFLIPPLVRKVLGIDLEEYGISIIPIFGVHFDSYAKLFGPNGIRKKCAIIADGDLRPSDATYNEGENSEESSDFVPPNLLDLENSFVKVFLCQTTFEKAITRKGTLLMLANTCKELGAVTISKHLNSLVSNEDMDKEDINNARNLVLSTAKRFGKARFSQVASKYVDLATSLPTYIKDSVNWLLANEIK